MQLDEFIKESLTQIMNGVIDAQKESVGKKYVINPYTRKKSDVIGNVMFDFSLKDKMSIDYEIILTNNTSNKNKGGIGVFLGGVGIGGQNDSTNENNNLTKVKFPIPVVFPGNEDESKLIDP